MKQNRSFLDGFDGQDYVEWHKHRYDGYDNEVSVEELCRGIKEITMEDEMIDICEWFQDNELRDIEANDLICDRWLGDSEYGLVESKPVFTDGIECSYAYLGCLSAEDGTPLKWTRLGSLTVEGVHGMTDAYDSFLPDGTPYKRIYLNFYSTHVPTTAPKGFRLDRILS